MMVKFKGPEKRYNKPLESRALQCPSDVSTLQILRLVAQEFQSLKYHSQLTDKLNWIKRERMLGRVNPRSLKMVFTGDNVEVIVHEKFGPPWRVKENE